MALTVGSVSINTTTCAASGGGMAMAIFNAFRQTSWDSFVHAERLAAFQGIADTATKLATAIVGEITANAEVSVTISAGGLQTIPVPMVPAGPTGAPLSPQTIAGVLR